jgi:hypothetical protein
MSNVAEVLIEKCGGHQAVAEMLGVDISRVYRFTYPKSKGGTGGLIPAWHMPTLIEKARLRGIEIGPDDFFPQRETAAAATVSR